MKRVTFIIDDTDFNDLRLWLEQRLPVEKISITDESDDPRAAALEEAARACEDTVTFTTEHYARDDGGPCGWCEGLEKAAAAIRKL